MPAEEADVTKLKLRILCGILAGLLLTGCSLFKGSDKTDPDAVDPNATAAATEDPALNPIAPPEDDPAENPSGSQSGEQADPSGSDPSPIEANPVDLPTPVVPDPGSSGTSEPTGTGTDAEPGGTRVTGIELDRYIVAVQVGKSEMPIVTMLPSTALDVGEIWTSDDTAVATVSTYGKITGVAPGECRVTVRSTDNPDVKATVDVTVVEDQDIIHVKQITLDKYECNILDGLSDMPWVTMYPINAQDKGEIWTSDDTSVATVNQYGHIMGVGPGTCTVTVRSKDNQDVTAKVTVNVKIGETVKEPTYIDGTLIVNRTYALPKTYNPGVSAEAKAALDELIAGASEDGLSFWIESGFRSYEQQLNLYNTYVGREGKDAADRYSARPGHSEHQSGLAFDLNSFDDNFDKTPEGQWLAAHAWEYGFTLRYPKDKEDITGFMYEPWHVRYVGKELAQKLHDSGKVLEEYFDITSVYAD